jgi:hypothetical protein
MYDAWCAGLMNRTDVVLRPLPVRPGRRARAWNLSVEGTLMTIVQRVDIGEHIGYERSRYG